jgi:diaminohydroxyphosphoribosylaminopyrimidine deaminase/5-amino-6-(5-phosphoribosylamino)uracil reductase
MSRADARWMRRALEAAARGRGRVSPNPLVGAAVVRGGRLVALGHHARYGAPHAEVAAIRRAGRRARGAALYVTLEPCAHQGKTPPCVRAILAAGIARVVAAIRDPNPLVNGRGLRALRRAGVKVSVGTLAPEARRLNEAYLTSITLGRPLVTLKSGMTLDGKIAASSGASRWITSPGARRAARALRSEHDAVLVGIGTALADGPRLTPRGSRGAGRRPLRVVLDSEARLPAGAPIFRAARGGPVIVYAAGGPASRIARLEKAGARVVLVRRGPGGVALPEVLADLARRGVRTLLVEGGSEVAWSFLREGAADRIALFVAPRLLGGRAAPGVVGGEGFRRPPEAVRVRDLRVRRIGADLLLTGRIAGGGGRRRLRYLGA